MDDTVIKAENISKLYHLGSGDPYKTLRESIVNLFRKPLKAEKEREELWALRDVSFEIKKGDTVGIIGRNGAGKSTLLKILARITEPTTGRITMKGRVGSLLEVGTGFHPELSGHENVYLYGAILGMDRYEVTRKFKEIVAFAELERFIETPVKRYSSGMYMRLAFAVAAHLESEILLVDEVLAVGDAAFQKKCLGKMGDVTAHEGRTVLFVSHNLQAVSTLCSKTLLLNNGTAMAFDETSKVVAKYLGQYSQSRLKYEAPNERDALGNEHISLIRASIASGTGNEKGPFTTGDSLTVGFEFLNKVPGITALDITCHIMNEMGILVFVTSTGLSMEKRFHSGRFRAIFSIPGDLLNEGTYTLGRLLAVKDRGIVLCELKDVLTFEIIRVEEKERYGWMGAKEGVIRPNLKWTFDHVTE